MSEDSAPLESSEGGLDVSEMVQKFDTSDHPTFHVEVTEKGDDVVYHFWPPEDETEFLEGFSEALESGFQDILAADAVVIAEYTDIAEANLRMKEGVGLVPQKDFHLEFVTARETYYVCVVDGTKNPLADTFLKGRVFAAIESHTTGESHASS